MARPQLKVTYKEIDPSRIPDVLTEGCAILLDLQQRGILDQVAEQLQVYRQGGYSGFELWLFLTVYFSTGAVMGIKNFYEIFKSHNEEIAALAHRRRLPSPSSLSRGLKAVTFESVRNNSDLLLMGLCESDSLLKHSAVMSYDCLGQGWHVFDLDPTVETLRHRALPASDDLPEAERRSKDTGKKGHSGRKRGDIQFRRMAVQHTGSGLWIHGQLSPGNGKGHHDFIAAIDSVVRTCERLQHPLNRTMLRFDGEFGNVPWFSDCRQRSVPFITRLNRIKLYQDPLVLQRLREAVWIRVPDSLSGPTRAAAEVGMLTLYPAKTSRRADGSCYEPITVRVIATRFKKEGRATSGKILDGYQVELFAVDVPADAWPAPEAAAEFFGRSAQENRFAQEERELGLGRIVAYHLAGQEMATLTALGLWNYRVVKGFELESPPNQAPALRPRVALIETDAPQYWPLDPILSSMLKELHWPDLLPQQPLFSWDETRGLLECLEHRDLTLCTIRSREKEKYGMIFRRPSGGCQDCSHRPGCLSSIHLCTPKHVEFAIDTEIARNLQKRLQQIRSQIPPQHTSERQIIDTVSGTLSVQQPLFLPAQARQTFREIFSRGSFRIDVIMPENNTVQSRLIAVDVAAKQQRRKTWAEHRLRYALPQDSSVHLEVRGSSSLRLFLGLEALHSQLPQLAVG